MLRLFDEQYTYYLWTVYVVCFNLRIMQQYFETKMNRKISRIFSLDRKNTVIQKSVLFMIVHSNPCPEKRN